MFRPDRLLPALAHGKAESMIRTMLGEWAFALINGSLSKRNIALCSDSSNVDPEEDILPAVSVLDRRDPKRTDNNLRVNRC